MSALPAAAQSLPAERNTRHGLIVGVGEYLDPDVPTLKSIPHDRVSARRMAAAMAAPEANTRMLRDHDATAESLQGCGKPGAASCSDAFGAALLRVEAVQ